MLSSLVYLRHDEDHERGPACEGVVTPTATGGLIKLLPRIPGSLIFLASMYRTYLKHRVDQVVS